MASGKTKTRDPAKRKPLSAALIAEAALKLIDATGPAGFSYRVLARELGCEAMSLYHYFPSKAHLFDAVTDIYLREMRLESGVGSWLERLRYVCWEFRAAALRHPGFFQFFSVYRLNSATGLHFLNVVLRIFEESGLDTEARARHFRVIGYFITGAALDEALGYAKGPSAAEPVPFEIAKRDYPAIMSVGPYFKPEFHATTFGQGVETLLARIAEEAAAQAGARRQALTGTV